MSKFKITSYLILIIFFLNNCGFTPQYAGFKNLEFDLVIDNVSGDRDFNNVIKSQIKKYDRGRDNIEKIKISYESDYKKIILSKNTKGEATKYNLKVKVIFDISSENFSTKIFAEPYGGGLPSYYLFQAAKSNGYRVMITGIMYIMDTIKFITFKYRFTLYRSSITM